LNGELPYKSFYLFSVKVESDDFWIPLFQMAIENHWSSARVSKKVDSHRTFFLDQFLKKKFFFREENGEGQPLTKFPLAV